MTKKNENSYEEKLKQFENVLMRLKSDELSISEAIELVKEGRKHYEACNELLDCAEEELEVFSK